MYLSRLILNERQLLVQRELSNAHALHQRIMRRFADWRGCECELFTAALVKKQG
ncbi:hypothetical protein ACVW01_000527 [Thermostichus sp. MS-CIW-19]